MQFYSKNLKFWRIKRVIIYLMYLRKLKSLKWDKEEQCKIVCDAES